MKLLALKPQSRRIAWSIRKGYVAIFEAGISLIQFYAFQYTVNKYDIGYDLITAFLKSMRLDLTKSEYKTDDEYKDYITVQRM